MSNFKALQAPATAPATTNTIPAAAGRTGGGQQAPAARRSAQSEMEDRAPLSHPFGLPSAAAGRAPSSPVAPLPALSREDPWALRASFGEGGPADPGATLDFGRHVGRLTAAQRVSLRLALDGADVRHAMGGNASSAFRGPFQNYGPWPQEVQGAAARPLQEFSPIVLVEENQQGPMGPVLIQAADGGNSATNRRLEWASRMPPRTPPSTVDVEEELLLQTPPIEMEVEIRSVQGDELSN